LEAGRLTAGPRDQPPERSRPALAAPELSPAHSAAHRHRPGGQRGGRTAHALLLGHHRALRERPDDREMPRARRLRPCGLPPRRRMHEGVRRGEAGGSDAPEAPRYGLATAGVLFRSSGMTCVPKSSIDDMAFSWGIVSVAIRNCSSSTPAASWMAMLRRQLSGSPATRTPRSTSVSASIWFHSAAAIWPEPPERSTAGAAPVPPSVLM